MTIIVFLLRELADQISIKLFYLNIEGGIPYWKISCYDNI